MLMQLKGLVYTFWRWLEIVSIRFWIPWEQMFFISHPPSPTTFTRLAYSWICVCGFVFTWINANMRSSQYTKQYFVLSHLRLFSYDFAIHKKTLPSTSALCMQKPHAMSPQREFRLRPLKLLTILRKCTENHKGEGHRTEYAFSADLQ